MRRALLLCLLLAMPAVPAWADPITRTAHIPHPWLAAKYVPLRAAVEMPLFQVAYTPPAGISSGSTAISGGTDTQVCFNDAATLSCGDAGLVYNKTTDILTVAEDLQAEVLSLEDSNASHRLRVLTTSDLTADRILTLVPGDAARTVTIGGNATISQDYSTTGTPQFARGGYGAPADTNIPLTVTNGAAAVSIAQFLDNVTPVFTIADGGQVQHTSGTSAAPSVSFISATGTGFYLPSASTFGMSVGGDVKWTMDASDNSSGINFEHGLGFSADPGLGAPDVGFMRSAAGALCLNTGSACLDASPASVTLGGEDGSGTDISGGAFILAAGRGTGTGTPGSLIFQTSDTLGTGTTLQTLVTRATINATGLGVGTTPPAGVELYVYKPTSGDANVQVQPASTANLGSVATFDSTGNVILAMDSAGSTATGSTFGSSDASYSRVVALGTASNGLKVGTTTADPLIIGTNDAERIRISSTGLTNIVSGAFSLNATAANQQMLSKTVTLTEAGGAETVITITSATTETFGLELSYRVTATDATDRATREGSLKLVCDNAATVLTCTKDATAESDDESVLIATGGATLTYAIAADVATANVAKITFNIDSSLVVSAASITWTATLNGPGTIS